jgi:NDP-sugar pyrophosphorylase family protein
MKAMIFAAGLGTRLKGETRERPKALVEVGGKPLLQHAIEKLKNSGFAEIVVNVHHFSDLVIQFLNKNDFGLPIHISDESEKLLETGGGLKKAQPFLTGSSPILLYNVDILNNIDIQKAIREHRKSTALATLIVMQRETQRYLKFNEENELVGWINKKTGETIVCREQDFVSAKELAFSGIHIIEPEIFDFMPQEDCFPIMDLYLELAKTKTIKGYFDDSDLWMDVGKPEHLEQARKLFS